MSIKDLTILHSNDMHGHFTGKKDENGRLSGSLAQVSGYVNQLKSENPNTLYCVAGDVFQGSLIDSDFQGLSTANILNMLDMDLMSLGNHELDYGISHIMFVDKCLDATIINANFKVKGKDVHLFQPYQIIEINGMKILFIGILTRNIIDQTKAEGLVGDLVEIIKTKDEVARITQEIKDQGIHIDLTILMTHIGYESDLKLARKLDPEWGVKLIIGAHSHTYLEQPVTENGVVIVQAGMENTHIGRIDLKIDTDSSSIAGYEYELIPVDEDHCPLDKMTRAMVSTYALDIDEKYSQIVTRLKRTLDNYGRQNPTELGQLYADAFRQSLPSIDVFILASSSMRCYQMEMTVSLQDLRESYPYDGKIFKVTVDGAMLRQMLTHALRDDVLYHHKETFYQTSAELHLRYSRSRHEITELTFNGEPVTDDQKYSIGLQEFYFMNSDIGFGMSNEQLQKYGPAKTISSDAFQVLFDYMSEHKGIGGPIDDRLIIED